MIDSVIASTTELDFPMIFFLINSFFLSPYLSVNVNSPAGFPSPQRVPEKEFLKAFKSNPRLRTKVNNFHRQMASNNNSEDDFVAIRPEWTTVDRILACRLSHLKPLPYMHAFIFTFRHERNLCNQPQSFCDYDLVKCIFVNAFYF